MENFSNILWVILVGASVVISIVSKNKEKQKAAQADAQRRAEGGYTGHEPHPDTDGNTVSEPHDTVGHPRTQPYSGENTRPAHDPYTMPTPAAPHPEDSWKQVFTEVKDSWKQVFTNEGKSTTEQNEQHRKPKPKAVHPHSAGRAQAAASTAAGLAAGKTAESEIYTTDEGEIYASQEPAASGISPHAAEGPQEGIMSDFELRKAVVWSEILKPKFNEESN